MFIFEFKTNAKRKAGRQHKLGHKKSPNLTSWHHNKSFQSQGIHCSGLPKSTPIIQNLTTCWFSKQNLIIAQDMFDDKINMCSKYVIYIYIYNIEPHEYIGFFN